MSNCTRCGGLVALRLEQEPEGWKAVPTCAICGRREDEARPLAANTEIDQIRERAKRVSSGDYRRTYPSEPEKSTYLPNLSLKSTERNKELFPVEEKKTVQRKKNGQRMSEKDRASLRKRREALGLSSNALGKLAGVRGEEIISVELRGCGADATHQKILETLSRLEIVDGHGAQELLDRVEGVVKASPLIVPEKTVIKKSTETIKGCTALGIDTPHGASTHPQEELSKMEEKKEDTSPGRQLRNLRMDVLGMSCSMLANRLIHPKSGKPPHSSVISAWELNKIAIPGWAKEQIYKIQNGEPVPKKTVHPPYPAIADKETSEIPPDEWVLEVPFLSGSLERLLKVLGDSGYYRITVCRRRA